MVFFTCNLCGESVKKPSVEKHYQQRCRGATKNVSCMDCLKDFYGEEYVSHIKCITEAEKYSGKDYVHKESKNSNAKKQESWMDIIRAILESSDYGNMSAPVRNAFQRLQSVDNVPRKKVKFENFVANCMRMSKHQATQVWEILEKELEKMKQAKQKEIATRTALQQKESKPQNGVKRGASVDNEQADSGIPKKIYKVEDKIGTPSDVINSCADDNETEFEWNNALEKIVLKHKEEGILLEKLKKKLLKKYMKKLELETLTEKQEKKFGKKLVKIVKRFPGVKLENDLVKSC